MPSFQVDLAQTLSRLTDVSSLRRGLAILVGLQRSGRLAPEHLPLLKYFKRCWSRIRRIATSLKARYRLNGRTRFLPVGQCCRGNRWE